MSRLGRDYLQVGYYTDSYFPDHSIRFIAINDCVDSDDGEAFRAHILLPQMLLTFLCLSTWTPPA